jgi:sterol desaturase/sphingolipid hydroxylase (fatty acid hydroxylase superfamily)
MSKTALDNAPAHPIDQLLFWALQPIMLIGVMAFWLLNPADPAAILACIFVTQLVLGILEYWRPARPHWRQRGTERMRNIGIFVFVLVGTAWISEWYAAVLAAPLTATRNALGMDIWPHDWPLLAQAALVFMLSELIWYWFHRAEHRFKPVWRFSGHGAHHSFKNLGAINAGANHPFEMFLLFLPAALVEVFFGVGIATVGAAVFTITQTAIAHTNIHMNSRGIGMLLTTNRYHIHHHSVVMDESNTNYGCATILWDRVFGTFSDGDTREAGTGPVEPTLAQKALTPFVEPADTQIAPR